MKAPSDLEILDAIYQMYYEEYASFDKENPRRKSKILVPIDCKKIGKKLSIDSDIVFGRLYYHLEKEYGYSRDGAKIVFFANSAGEEIHCINFPYMVSILGKLKHEYKQFTISSIIAAFALLISFAALIVSLLKDSI